MANYSAAGLPLEAQWIDIDQSEPWGATLQRETRSRRGTTAHHYTPCCLALRKAPLLCAALFHKGCRVCTKAICCLLCWMPSLMCSCPQTPAVDHWMDFTFDPVDFPAEEMQVCGRLDGKVAARESAWV